MNKALLAAIEAIEPTMSISYSGEELAAKAIKAFLDNTSISDLTLAIWNWEHDGRANEVLDIEWRLLKTDYIDKAKAIIEHLKRSAE